MNFFNYERLYSCKEFRKISIHDSHCRILRPRPSLARGVRCSSNVTGHIGRKMTLDGPSDYGCRTGCEIFLWTLVLSWCLQHKDFVDWRVSIVGTKPGFSVSTNLNLSLFKIAARLFF